MEYSPVACMRQGSRCCRSEILGCLPRNFHLARAMALALRVRMQMRSASNSAKVARMLKNILSGRSISTLSLTLPSINVDNARLTHPASEFQGLESERRTFRPWDPVDALPPLTLVDFCPARHLELLPRGGVDPQTASVVKMIELLLANDAEAQPTHTMAAPYAGKRDWPRTPCCSKCRICVARTDA